MGKQVGLIGTTSTTLKSVFDLVAFTAVNATNLAEAGIVESHFFKLNRTKENLEEAGYEVTGAQAQKFLSALVQESLAGRPKEPTTTTAEVMASLSLKTKE